MNNDASQDEQMDGYDDSNTLESRMTDDTVSDTDESLLWTECPNI